MVSYQVYALEGFFLEGVDAPIKVAWVHEENLRTGEQIDFWALTSLQELTACEMRELAHWRWDIENNGFKSLNNLVNTKHLYAHDPHAAQAFDSDSLHRRQCVAALSIPDLPGRDHSLLWQGEDHQTIPPASDPRLFGNPSSPRYIGRIGYS